MDKKYDELKTKSKIAKLEDFKIPQKTYKLCYYNFDKQKVVSFSFKFTKIKPTPKSDKYVSAYIHGNSKHLEDLPIAVTKNGELRIVISSDFPEVYHKD